MKKLLLILLLLPLTAWGAETYEMDSMEVQFAHSMIRYANILRQREGLGRYKWDSCLEQAAANKAFDMYIREYRDHRPPGDDEIFRTVDDLGCEYDKATEHYTYGFQTPHDSYAWLKQSPDHHPGLVDPNHTKIGVGVFYGGGRDTITVTYYTH